MTFSCFFLFVRNSNVFNSIALNKKMYDKIVLLYETYEFKVKQTKNNQTKAIKANVL